MRKLASIQRIESIDPIPGRDKIGLATVENWHVIVRLSDYIPGDLCVYVEIDSVLPDKPEFEFLRSKKFRIRTMKLGGVISEGICFPLSILPEQSLPYNIGDDVTDIIGIKKYDEYPDEPKPVEELKERSWIRRFLFRHKLTRPIAKLIWGGSKKERRGFPEEVSRTDEERCQNLNWDFLLSLGLRYEVREKIDGQSATYLLRRNKGIMKLFKPFEFIVASRNIGLATPDDSPHWEVALRYNIEGVLKNLIGNNQWVCIQGECVGPKIQGNPYGLTENDLYCFNLIYPEGKYEGVLAEPIVCGQGLKWVPMVDASFILPDTCDEMLKLATGTSRLANVMREGLVLRNYAKHVSFKAVSREYLIKHEK